MRISGATGPAASEGPAAREPSPPRRRRAGGTATSAFGVSRRESHDSTEFYRRFTAPVVCDDDAVCHPDDRPVVDQLVVGDIRDRQGSVAPGSVALVVTSPPYYSGKEYEAAMGEGHVPASYTDYLAMLSSVLGACARALEPGGRMAVNVANLGRKPYRSLSSDVIRIMEEELGLLLRGELVWRKARGAAGNCAWGSFQKPADPVLRDLTERVVIASKGRFDRAIPAVERATGGYPSEASIFRDEFLEATVDLWEIAPERASRVGHPAPFPVELPQRLIDLYTYRGDLVLDPFVGSGTTAVAALRTGRHFLGYDADPGYVTSARERVEAERRRLEHEAGRPGHLGRPVLPPVAVAPDPGEDLRGRGLREGRRARELARWTLEEAGFTVVAEDKRLGAGVEVTFVAEDGVGREWLVDFSGAFTSTPAGLQRPENLWKAIGQATVVQHTGHRTPYLVLTTDKPAAQSAGGRALGAVTGARGKPIHDVVSLGVAEDLDRLRRHAGGQPHSPGGGVDRGRPAVGHEHPGAPEPVPGRQPGPRPRSKRGSQPQPGQGGPGPRRSERPRLPIVDQPGALPLWQDQR